MLRVLTLQNLVFHENKGIIDGIHDHGKANGHKRQDSGCQLINDSGIDDHPDQYLIDLSDVPVNEAPNGIKAQA